jgi:hypothetical protein
MESEPPSQPPRTGAVALARGTLRDGLGALGNLALLSGSAKVGSKAIAGVLPDVLSSCGPMRDAARSMLAELAGSLDGATVLQELEVFVIPRLDELERELHERVNSPFRTPARLGLDRVLTRLSRELDAAQALLELLEVASRETNFPLSIPDLLRQRLPAPPSGRRPHKRFQARLVIEGPAPEVLVKPRTISGLVGALAEIADDRGAPAIVLRDGADGYEIAISNDPAPKGEELSLWGYGVITPSQAALDAAAALAGVTIVPGDGATILRFSSRS